VGISDAGPAESGGEALRIRQRVAAAGRADLSGQVLVKMQIDRAGQVRQIIGPTPGPCVGQTEACIHDPEVRFVASRSQPIR